MLVSVCLDGSRCWWSECGVYVELIELVVSQVELKVLVELSMAQVMCIC